MPRHCHNGGGQIYLLTSDNNWDFDRRFFYEGLKGSLKELPVWGSFGVVFLIIFSLHCPLQTLVDVHLAR